MARTPPIRDSAAEYMAFIQDPRGRGWSLPTTIDSERRVISPIGGVEMVVGFNIDTYTVVVQRTIEDPDDDPDKRPIQREELSNGTYRNPLKNSSLYYKAVFNQALVDVRKVLADSE